MRQLEGLSVLSLSPSPSPSALRERPSSISRLLVDAIGASEARLKGVQKALCRLAAACRRYHEVSDIAERPGVHTQAPQLVCHGARGA